MRLQGILGDAASGKIALADKGLRRGVLPALASLLAVLVSALVSIFGARLLAGIAAPRVVELLPPDMMADAGAMAGMMTLLVSSLIAIFVFGEKNK